MRRTALAPLALAAMLAGCGSGNSRMQSDWERAHEARMATQEGRSAGVQPPAPPRPEALLPFAVTSASDFRFFVDPESIRVEPGRVVRYTLVARSPSGVDNVTYEGMNCADGEYAIYAVALPDGKWRTAPAEWKPIERRSVQRWHEALFREYFCPRGIAVSDAAEAVDALRRGGHPLARDATPR